MSFYDAFSILYQELSKLHPADQGGLSVVAEKEVFEAMEREIDNLRISPIGPTHATELSFFGIKVTKAAAPDYKHKEIGYEFKKTPNGNVVGNFYER